MLAIVEHEHELLRAERVRDRQRRCRARSEFEPERGSDGDRDELGIGRAAPARWPKPRRQCWAAGRATSRPRRVLPMPPAPVRVTSRCAAARPRISSRSSSRPISSETGSGRLVGGSIAAGSAAASAGLVRARRHNADLAGKLVAASGDRADQLALRPEGGAQRRDLGLQAVLLDDPVGPDALPSARPC